MLYASYHYQLHVLPITSVVYPHKLAARAPIDILIRAAIWPYMASHMAALIRTCLCMSVNIACMVHYTRDRKNTHGNDAMHVT